MPGVSLTNSGLQSNLVQCWQMKLQAPSPLSMPLHLQHHEGISSVSLHPEAQLSEQEEEPEILRKNSAYPPKIKVVMIYSQQINELFCIYSMKILKVVRSGVMMSNLCKITITCICWYLALRVSFFVLIAGASKWSSSASSSACVLTTSIFSYQGKITKTYVQFGRIQ